MDDPPKMALVIGLVRAHRTQPVGLRLRRPGRATALPHRSIENGATDGCCPRFATIDSRGIMLLINGRVKMVGAA